MVVLFYSGIGFTLILGVLMQPLYTIKSILEDDFVCVNVSSCISIKHSPLGILILYRRDDVYSPYIHPKVKVTICCATFHMVVLVILSMKLGI